MLRINDELLFTDVLFEMLSKFTIVVQSLHRFEFAGSLHWMLTLVLHSVRLSFVVQSGKLNQMVDACLRNTTKALIFLGEKYSNVSDIDDEVDLVYVIFKIERVSEAVRTSAARLQNATGCGRRGGVERKRYARGRQQTHAKTRFRRTYTTDKRLQRHDVIS